MLKYLGTSALLLAVMVGAADGARAQASDDKSDPELEAIKRAEALAKAQTAASQAQEAAAKAETARIEAEAAAARRELGLPNTPTGPTGNSNFGSNPGKSEANLLYARALSDLGEQLGQAICPKTGSQPKPSFVLGGTTGAVELGDLVAYRIKRFVTLKSLDDAVASVDTAISQARALKPDPPRNADASDENARSIAAVLAGADAAIGSLAKLGGYFRSVYTFGEVAITPSDDMLAAALHCNTATIVNPAIMPVSDLADFLSPATAASLREEDSLSLLTPIARMEYLRNRAFEAAARADALADNKATADKQAVAVLRASITGANAAIARLQSFLDDLTAVSATATTPKIVLVARQEKMRKLLENQTTRMVVLRQSVGGAYYTQDNLWTFLGGPPLYVMGGVSLSYSLVNPQNGQVETSGILVRHGGYRSLRNVERLINGTVR